MSQTSTHPTDARAVALVADTNATTMASYIELTKPGITRLVTITSGVGFVMSSIGRPFAIGPLVLTLIGCLIGTALSASGANALNQVMEWRRDRRMPRTAKRPIPEGRLSPSQALVAGLLLSVAGLIALLAVAGPAPALVSLVTIVLYIGIYTPLKPVSPLSTLVGAIPGALPPLIGWTAAASAVSMSSGMFSLSEAGGWSLFALMFIWQIPHFLAIAWMYRDDYRAGGYRMLPLQDPTGSQTSLVILLGAIALLPVTLAPMRLIDGASIGWFYMAVAVITGLGFIVLAARLMRHRTDAAARRVFIASIIHLPLLLMAMVADALFSVIL